MADWKVFEEFKCSSGVNDRIMVRAFGYAPSQLAPKGDVTVAVDCLAYDDEDNGYFTVHLTPQQVKDLAAVFAFLAAKIEEVEALG